MSGGETGTRDPGGSQWHPHIHAPGIVLNNWYRGADTRETFLEQVEMSSPRIRRLAGWLTLSSSSPRQRAFWLGQGAVTVIPST